MMSWARLFFWVAPVSMVLPVGANATTLDLFIGGEYADVSVNGGAYELEDLSIEIAVDPASLSSGTGDDGSDEYKNVTASVTSTGLGLSGVTTTNDLSFDIGFPTAGAPVANTAVALEDVGGGTHQGVFNLAGLAAWNETSAFALQKSFSFGNTIHLDLSNGETLAVDSFDDNSNAFGNAFFSAAVATPEPDAAGIFGMAVVTLIGLTAMRRTGRASRQR